MIALDNLSNCSACGSCSEASLSVKEPPNRLPVFREVFDVQFGQLLQQGHLRRGELLGPTRPVGLLGC